MTTDLTTRDLLAKLPELAAEAWMTWDAPNPGPAAVPGAGPQGFTRVPTNLATLQALRVDTSGLLFELCQCSRLVADLVARMPAPWWPARDACLLQPHRASWVGECDYLLEYAPLWESDPFTRGAVDSAASHAYDTLSQITRQPRELIVSCPTCGDVMRAQHGGQYSVCDSGHQHPGPLTLAAQWRRKPPVPAAIIEMELGVKPSTLWQWKRRGKIAPAYTDGRVDYWLPWDVLRRVYPDLVTQLDKRGA